MAIESDYRPYAPPANVIAVIHRVQTRNTPPKIDAEFLSLLNVSPGNVSRVLKALEFYGLVKEDGTPTDTLDSLGGAPPDEYKKLLSNVLKEAYSAEYSKGLDPAADSQPAIESYFAPCQPRSQTSRMAVLFLGMCREAGIELLDKPKDRKMQEKAPGTSAKRTRPAAKKGAAPMPESGEVLPSSQLGITQAELMGLPEDEFDKVWDSLKVIYSAKRHAAQQQGSEEPAESEA